MQVKKQQLEPDMEEQTAPNRKRSTSRLYIVTLLIYLYAEYIMRNVDEAQAGIKIAGRNINKLRYQMTPSYGRKRRTIELLDESKRGE